VGSVGFLCQPGERKPKQSRHSGRRGGGEKITESIALGGKENNLPPGADHQSVFTTTRHGKKRGGGERMTNEAMGDSRGRKHVIFEKRVLGKGYGGGTSLDGRITEKLLPTSAKIKTPVKGWGTSRTKGRVNRKKWGHRARRRTQKPGKQVSLHI